MITGILKELMLRLNQNILQENFEFEYQFPSFLFLKKVCPEAMR